MPAQIDATGQRYGRLVVIGDRRVVGRTTQWLCRCDCGTNKHIALNSLRSGLTTSCGCRRDEVVVARSRSHGRTGSPEYRSWAMMRSRCSNPNASSYDYYGGRGIRICERWSSFEAFLEDMGPRPGPDYSIERLDNDGDYEPGNCRWASRVEQANNRRNNRLLTHDGETATVAEWARRLGIDRQVIYQRLHRGWPLKRVLRPPKT